MGTAVFTGAGVAHATEGDDSGGATGQEQGEANGTTQEKDSGNPGKIDLKLPRLSDIVGRHRADASTPDSNTASSIVKRLTDAAKRVTTAIESAADADNTVVRTSTTTNTGRSPRKERIAARPERDSAQEATVDTLTASGAAQNNQDSAPIANRVAAAKDWFDSPRAVAGRSVDTTSTVTTPLWTPPQVLAPLGTMTATPGTGTTAVRSVLTTVLGAANPFAGNSPGSPAGVDSPLSWVFAGAARREIGIESLAPTALLAPTTNSLTYDPVIGIDNGVVTGLNMPSTGVRYLVVSQPDGGGKVYVDPTTGNFTYLPDLSSVQNPDAAETFKVLVAENTAFTTAITGIPVIGSLASQVLLVLYQVPVVNVVLSPIIGKSEITDVSIALAEHGFNAGDPIAFTVMVPSTDGVMISTNYFPATTVVQGKTDAAPTVLNGPGLATAGNIDPDAPNTVDGLVPGIDEMRDAGFNVVTWDPRGEFDSTGRLELDSPEYEGQDVKSIISWVVDNREYTFQEMETEDPSDPTNPATNDPWIGMVGGSYGGGIQLVSAAIDSRIDVIVPGIAWNNLNDSLYTNQAFKTSYSSLLLLGLVTTGARINPRIYGGIITGAVLGVLTPGQQQLLERSGPWDIEGGIDVPTLLVQGTVDVLFPLHQAIVNAENIGTTDVSMIWFCGGHGVCLTMTPDQLEQQDQFLLNNTLSWLDQSLPEEYTDDEGNVVDPYDGAPVKKFQFVDQLGRLYSADELPTAGSPFFGADLTDLVDPAAGGRLVIVPVLGGSGPQSEAGFPYSLGLGAPATNAITVPIDPGLSSGDTYVVGSPHLTFDYQGIGTSRHVYAQIVDTNTGLVVGNIVTPVDVTLDGRQRTAEVDMEDIAWTYTDDSGDPAHPVNYDDLELQIVGSATPYLNFTEYGYINVSHVALTFPTAGADAHVQPENWPAVPAAV
ncbi:peptidase S15 [Mycolicibacterium moriokaense]|nr:peptidase S15 [Mycolicibacterium moriokaense]